MVKEWDLKSHGVSPRRFKSCSWRLFIQDNLTNNAIQEYTEISSRAGRQTLKASEESHLLLVAQWLLRGWMMVDLVLILSGGWGKFSFDHGESLEILSLLLGNALLQIKVFSSGLKSLRFSSLCWRVLFVKRFSWLEIFSELDLKNFHFIHYCFCS